MALWLVGAGPMAEAYSKVLRHLQIEFCVVGRTRARTQTLGESCGVLWADGGVRSARRKFGMQPEEAIVAVPVERLHAVTQELIEEGAKRILVEKPGGYDLSEVRRTADAAEAAGVECYVGFNRRFLPSVQEVRRRILDARGALTVQFDFTENVPRLMQLHEGVALKSRWAFANSAHVVDTAFFLCGSPATLDARVYDRLEWHPAGAAFQGMGQTVTGTLFMYGTDWRGPGRWGIEIVLPKERLYLRPMESLYQMRLGEFEVEEVEVAKEPPGLKPGLLAQTNAFLSGDPERQLPTMRDHAEGTAALVSRIAGYDAEERRAG